MTWHIETLNGKVDAELDALPNDLKAKFLHIVELIEQFGPMHVREPYVKPLKVSQTTLWEIRMKGKSGIARAIYVTAKNKRVVVLHAFIKKTQKTPKSAIDTALRRLKEFV